QLRGGHVSAARALERAAALSADNPSRAGRLVAAAESAWIGGQEDYARDLITRALPVADRAQQARLLYLRGVIESNCGSLLEGAATEKHALVLTEDPSLILEILRDGCAMASQAGSRDDARAFALRAASVPHTTEFERFTKASLAAWAADLSGEYVRGMELSTELGELAEPLDISICMIWAALAAVRAGLREASLRYGSRAVAIAREQSDITRLPFCLGVQAIGLTANGRFELAYASAEEGRNLAVDIGQPWAVAWNVMSLALIDALRGADDLTHSHVAELQRWVARSGAVVIEQRAQYALALLQLGHGHPDEALDELLRIISAAPLENNPLPLVLAQPDAVEAAVRTNRADEVVEHLDSFREWAQRSEHPIGLALSARCEALVEPGDPEPLWERAIALADALAPIEQGRTALLYGEWLRRQRRRIDARRQLRAALELFEGLGAAPWEARARAELRASGETARKRDPSTRDQLTPQELQIARLVASGKTNPEIAAQLFLSPRTIDYHLRKVFAKLDIASRAQLANLDLGDPIAA
ncbi:MAG TPA: LuxR C-terminal-related transcriptional regulator, partial [Solirubrobacteraceae bacterium]|nr:LuxR C-terminal-related transcriptional regulator [Solirubrobacteraceae bacterium]